MNYNIYVSLLSRVFPKNPYDATGLSDSAPASPIELEISRITVDFGRNCQDKPNFTARVHLGAAQKSDTHQKTTAIKARRGFVLCN